LELFETIRPHLGTIGIRRAHPVFNAKTGETEMSTTTYDRMAYETKATVEFPIEQHLKNRKSCSREEEFRSALGSYLEDYRQHNAMIATGRHNLHSSHFKFFERFTDWICG
jgi:hypothetical protein